MVRGGKPGSQGHGLIGSRIDLEPRGHFAVDDWLEIHSRRAFGPQFHRDGGSVHRGHQSGALPGKANRVGVSGVNAAYPARPTCAEHGGSTAACATAALAAARSERASDGCAAPNCAGRAGSAAACTAPALVAARSERASDGAGATRCVVATSRGSAACDSGRTPAGRAAARRMVAAARAQPTHGAGSAWTIRSPHLGRASYHGVSA